MLQKLGISEFSSVFWILKEILKEVLHLTYVNSIVVLDFNSC